MHETSKIDVEIRPAVAADAGALARIYNFYIRETIVTFEEEALPDEEMARRLEEVQSASLPWLVAAYGDEIVGYAYATNWKRRYGYRFSAEVTVYLDPDYGGKGIGSALYDRLIPLVEMRGIRVVIGGIALPNDASVALHEKFGFQKVAQFREVGIKFDKWIDVGYWEKILPPDSNARPLRST